MGWLLTVVCALAPFAVWGLRVYYLQATNAARDADRKEGADANQNEAHNEEDARIIRAADAAGRVPVGRHDPDPYDLDASK